MTKEALTLALEALERLDGWLALRYGSGLTPEEKQTVTAIKEALAQPEQEINKNGSPCPEFWDWLPKAYNFEGNGNFTKYNMEVAFLAGKQASQPEQEPKCVAVVEVFGKDWRLDFMSLPVGKHKLYAQQYTHIASTKQELVGWKLVPIEPTNEMLKAMDECSTEGYDERLYAGHAAYVYMAAVDVAPTPPQRKPLTDEMRKQMKERCDSMEMRGAFADGWLSAEAAHGIKE